MRNLILILTLTYLTVNSTRTRRQLGEQDEAAANTAGSILDEFNSIDEPIPEEIDIPEPLSPSQTAQDRVNDYIQTLDDEAQALEEENERLEEENEELTKEMEEAQQQLQLTDDKINESTRENGMEKQVLEKTIKDFELYNRFINNKDYSDDEDYDDTYILEASKILAYVVALGCFFLLLQGCRIFVADRIDDNQRPALYALFLDCTLLALLSVLTNVLNWLDWFDETKIDFAYLIVGLALFTVFYFITGFWYILATQSISRRWFEMEARCREIKKLQQDFDLVHEQWNEDSINKTTYRNVHREIQYAVMRQEFIAPTHIPSLRESYLRSDFDFAEYLSRCLAGGVNQIFRLSWATFMFLIFCVGTWRALIYLDGISVLAVAAVVPVCISILLFIVLQKLFNVFYNLVPYIEDPHEISFPETQYTRDPNFEKAEVPLPPYLEGRLLPRGKGLGNFNLLCFKMHPLELTYAYIFEGMLPNRHQVLFWFDSAGPRLIIYLLQSITVMLIMWIVVLIMYYAKHCFEELGAIGILVIVFSTVVWLFILMYLVPETMRLLTLTSKIGHMKDQNQIHKVAHREKANRERRNVRFYRVVKLVRREFIKKDNDKEERKVLPSFMVDHLREAFLFHVEPEKDYIILDNLEDCLKSCGFQLTEDENRAFAKACTDKNYQISFRRFCVTVETFIRETQLDPQIVVKKVLVRFFQSIYPSPEIQQITMADIKAFLEKFSWHLSPDDIGQILHEVRYLLNTESQVSIEELASLVRDDVEMFPKQPNCVKRQNESVLTQKMAFDMKFSLLDLALKHAAAVGWNDLALIKGAAELGLPPISARAICPSGPIEIVDHAVNKWSRQLEVDMPTGRIADADPQQRYFKLIQRRLEFQGPYRETWSQALGLGVNDINTSIYRWYDTIDTICNLADDVPKSDAAQYLARRAIIGKVYTFTEIRSLTDSTEDMSVTWDFLDDQLKFFFGMSSTFDNLGGAFNLVAKGAASAFDAIRPVPQEHANPIKPEHNEEKVDSEEKQETPEKQNSDTKQE